MTRARPKLMRIRRKGGRRRGWWLVTGAAAGATLAYVFDPARGRHRRHLARQRAAGAVRHSARYLARRSRAAALQTLGHAKGALHNLRPPAGEPATDAELAHKVESVLFRDRQVPKGKISIDAEGGTVFMRGQIESEELIREIVHATSEIPDVVDVVNLLHLPGTEAPHPPAGRLLATSGSPS